VRRMLRARELDLVLARTSDRAPDVDSAALRPTPAVLCVPEGHRLAGAGPVALKELDGERLLTWSPRGTAFTDLLLAHLAAAGADVEPVESRITGSVALTELANRGAVALMPAGYAPFPGIAQVALSDDVTLPLLVLWPTGAPSAAVRRVREAMTSAG
jgi:LysR substrate binding domain